MITDLDVDTDDKVVLKMVKEKWILKMVKSKWLLKMHRYGSKGRSQEVRLQKVRPRKV